jgi:hypothetical protein
LEFCKKNGEEINIGLIDPATAKDQRQKHGHSMPFTVSPAR